jgi:hypothetical protein
LICRGEVFANRYTAAPAGEFITSLPIAYGLRGFPGAALRGTPVQLLLFRDNNNAATPSEPILLASAASTVIDPGTNTFNQILIPPTFVEAPSSPACSSATSPPTARFRSRSTRPCPKAIDGNYLIRAEGVAIPEPSALATITLGSAILMG